MNNKDMYVLAKEKIEPGELAEIIVEWIQYRKIGTIEECREAIDKQKPKKVERICGVLNEKYECPECGSSLSDMDLFTGYCKWCGQKITNKNLEGMEDE